MPPQIVEIPEDRCPYPPGTKVRYWHFPLWPDVAGANACYKGVVEIIDEKSEHPPYVAFPKARIGAKVIRFINDDGTPSFNYVSLDQPIARNEPKRWYAEDESPLA